LKIGRQTAAWNNTVEMGVKKQILPPGVKDGEKTDAGAQVFGIGGDAAKRFGSSTKEDIVDDFLVQPGKRSDAVGQSKDQVEIRNRQKLCLMFLKPLSFGEGLTFGTVAIAAGIVADPAMAAAVTLVDVVAENGGSTDFDCMHDALLF
jgi:hypothetical protein